MRQSMLEILRGSFLVQQGALRNWRLIFFFFFLAGVMITSSHNIDQKVMQISALNAEIQALKSQFAETRTQAMYMRLERPFNPDGVNFHEANAWALIKI